MTKALRSLIFALSCACVAAPVHAMLSTGTILWYAGPSLAFVAAKVMRFLYDKSQQLNRIEDKVEAIKQQIDDRCKKLSEELKKENADTKQALTNAKQELELFIKNQDNEIQETLKKHIDEKFAPFDTRLKQIGEDIQEVNIAISGLQQKQAQQIEAFNQMKQDTQNILSSVDTFKQEQVEQGKQILTLQKHIGEMPNKIQNQTEKMLNEKFLQQNQQIEQKLSERDKINEEKLDIVIKQNEDIKQQITTLKIIKNNLEQEWTLAFQNNNKTLLAQIEEQYALANQNLLKLIEEKFVTKEEHKRDIESLQKQLKNIQDQNSHLTKKLDSMDEKMNRLIQIACKTSQDVEFGNDVGTSNFMFGVLQNPYVGMQVAQNIGRVRKMRQYAPVLFHQDEKQTLQLEQQQ
jgi:chromosome segregation ATPase